MRNYSRHVSLAIAFLLSLAGATTATAQSANAVVRQDAPIMLLPDPTRTPLRVAPAGTRLITLGVEGQWLRVQFDDPRLGRRNGYIESRFVQADQRPAAVPAPRPTPVEAPVRPISETENAVRQPELVAAVTATPTAMPAASSGPVLTFRKVDYSELQGDKERSRSARMVLDPVARSLTFAHEGNGEAKEIYAKIPYDAISKIVYEQSSHRRYGAGVMVSPLLFFTKGKKHWLTIEFKNVSALPQGFVYARLDKDNYRQILSALRAGTGISIEEHIED